MSIGLIGLLGILAGLAIVFKPALAVIFIFLIGVSIIVYGLLVRPTWICYMIVFFTPLISGLARGELIPLFRPNEPLLLGLFTIMVIARLVNSSKGFRIRITPVDLSFIILFFGGTLIPMLMFFIRESHLSLPGLFVYISILQYYMIYRIVIETVKTEQEIANVIKLILLSGLIVTIVAILEAIHFPGVERYLLTFYPSAHLLKTLNINRIVSILGNWHALAAYTIIQLIIVIVFWLRSRGIISIWLLITSGISSLVAMVPIVSLAGMAGLSSMIISILILIRKSWRIMLFVFLVLIIALSIFWPFVQERFEFQFSESSLLQPKTGVYRLQVWSNVFWPTIKNHILFGYAPTIPEGFGWQSFESQYIALLFKGGILYLIAHLFFVIYNGWWLYKKWRLSTSIVGLCALCALISIFVMSVMSLSNEYFSYSGVMETLWILLGLATTQVKG